MIAQSRIVRNVSIAAFGMLALVMTVTMTASSAHAENGVDVTYYKDVLPIIQENCQSCHRPAGLNISGLVAPMSFMTFEDTRPWARSIARKVESREMPPWCMTISRTTSRPTSSRDRATPMMPSPGPST